MKKQNWLLDHLFLVCAIVFYLIAAICACIGNARRAMTWFCIGSLYVCIYFVQMTNRKRKQMNEE